MSQIPDPGEREAEARRNETLYDPMRQELVPTEDKVEAVQDQVFTEIALNDDGPQAMPLRHYGEFILAAWADEAAADDFVTKHSFKGIKDLAIVKRDEQGKLHIYDRREGGLLKGAAIGGAIGGALGLLFPPALFATAAAGATIGGLVERLTDSGFADDRLASIGESLQADSSVIVAIADFDVADAFKQALTASGAKLRSGLGSNTLNALAQLHDSDSASKSGWA